MNIQSLTANILLSQSNKHSNAGPLAIAPKEWHCKIHRHRIVYELVSLIVELLNSTVMMNSQRDVLL